MQIVIDIPEEIYQKIKETNMFISDRRSGRRLDYILFNAVNTGIPLSDYQKMIRTLTVNLQEPKYCDRNICIKNEYNGIGCDECEVTKSQKIQEGEE